MFQYFAKIIDGTIAGRFRTNQGTAVAETLACQNAVFKVSFESSILTEEIADLPLADTHIADRHIRIGTDITI